MTMSNSHIVRRLLHDVWTEGNVDAADGLVAPLYEIRHDPGDPWDGKTLDLAAYKDRVRKSRAPFPDQKFLIQEIHADGDSVTVAWRWEGTHRGDLPGFPASGKRISTSGITIYFLANGRAAGHWQVVDRLGVFQQLSRRTDS